MGSKERKARNRLNMHKDILHAALNIVRKEGYRSLSLRRLANDIDYSPTVMYLYFKNKEALELDLARLGYQQFNFELQLICKFIVDPRERLKGILMAYWHFATSEKQLYLLIQEVEMRTDDLDAQLPELVLFVSKIDMAINDIYRNKHPEEEFLKRKRYVLIATVQGLISIHLTHKELDMQTKTVLLTDTIDNLLKV